MHRALIPLIALASVAGCSGGRESARPAEEGPHQDPLLRYESDFRPSDHDTVGLRSHEPGPAAPRPAAETPPAPSPGTPESELVPGFRVQIFSTTDIDQANARKQEAEADFPTEWIYLQYDPPTYKIRAGNFLQRYEAERFARMAIEKGFKDSWAVPEKVFRQPPPVSR